MYDKVKSRLKKTGELMVFTDAGEEHELHLHNVTFHDDEELVEIDAADEIHWLAGNKIERMWIHKDF